MKNTLFAIAVTAVIIYLFIPLDRGFEPESDDVTVIQFWHPWSGEYADALSEVIAEFNRTHPEIHVNALFMPTGAGENMKFFVSVAGGVPPDVIVVDGTQVASWAALGVLQPLGQRMKDAGIKQEDFWEPCREQCRYNGQTYALSAAADPNFSLVWNKHLFREAGLDPEVPPRTIEELEDKYIPALTKTDPDTGRIEQLAFLPTYTSDAANALLTWGWAFGGSFYNPETDEYTCDDPRVVEALRWLLHIRDLYGGQKKLLAFRSGFGDAAQSPFYVGKLAMHISYIAETQNIHKFAPNLEYGISQLPVPEGMEPGSANWVGGWTLALPTGDRGNEDAAFELIRWITADPAGTTYMSRKMKLLPAYSKSPFFKTDVEDDPILSAYREILETARHARPVTPANAHYMYQLRRCISRAMEDLHTPEEGLERARADTEKYYEKLKRRMAVTKDKG